MPGSTNRVPLCILDQESMLLSRSLLVLSCLLFILSCKHTTENRVLTNEDFQLHPSDIVFTFTESVDVAFAIISSVKMDEFGHIIVSDFRLPYLSVFDQTGAFIQRVGQQGKGPGEFERIGNFVVHGNSLYITDRINLKIEQYSLVDGRYIHSQTYAFSGADHVGNLLAVQDEHFFMQNSSSIGPDQFIFSSKRISHVVRMDKVLSQTDTLLTYPSLESLVSENGEFLLMVKPLGNRGHLVFDLRSGMYTNWSRDLNVRFTDFDGIQRQVLEYQIEKSLVSDHEKDSVLTRFGTTYRSDLLRQMPNFHPVVLALKHDSVSRLWLEIQSQDLGEYWYSFSGLGEPMSRVKKPIWSAKLEYVKGDTILWSFVDSSGAPGIGLTKVSK